MVYSVASKTNPIFAQLCRPESNLIGKGFDFIITQKD